MCDLYRGYIPLNGKAAAMPFKNKRDDELYTLDQVRHIHGYAGVLAQDTILIDVDETEPAERLLKIVREKELKCRVYKTTRGCHFLFRNGGRVESNKTHTTLAIGIEADIKLGSRASYEALKVDGTPRPLLYDAGTYEVVPKWLIPINTRITVYDLDEADGRNTALFSYILPLQAAGLSVDECKETLNLINEYIFKVRLDEHEMATITRDASFEKQTFFNERGKFEFDRFAHWLVDTYSIVKIDGRLHIYQDGIYVPDENIIESAMIGEIRKLSDAQRKEVLKYLNILVLSNTKRSDARYIAFNNGIYDIFTDELLDFDPNFVITNKIPFNYNPKAESEVVDRTLNKLACQDKEVRALLEEMVGYCFYTRNELGKAFILIGDKSNGKSTFLDMITTALGSENVSSLDMNELDETFKTAELFGKLANIGDDIGDEFIPNSAIFKKLVTGNRVNVQRKFANPFDFNNYSKLLFSANNLPRIKDKTGAVQRRLVIIPFHATFSKKDPDYDPFIRYKLVEPHNMEYLIKCGVQGLKRVLENQAFSECAQVTKELRDYEAVNNPITVFLDELEEDEVVNESTRDVYSKYQQFCLADNLNPMGLGEFSKAIKKRFNVDIVDRRVDGKRLRIFVKS